MNFLRRQSFRELSSDRHTYVQTDTSEIISLYHDALRVVKDNFLNCSLQNLIRLLLRSSHAIRDRWLAVYIHSFFKRLRRFGYINCVMTIDDMIDHSDYELFTKVCSGSHSLHHLLPSYRTSDLLLRGHPFQLPDYYTDLYKKSFVVRSLYAYIN